MDPITIGFGVASLLPLPVELFKQSAQAYKLFLEAKNIENTMVHFALRLEIEYHRLVQWGHNCGLVPIHGQDGFPTTASNLFRNAIHKSIVERILHHIKELLEDAATLSKKYGVVFSTRDVGGSNGLSSLSGRLDLSLSLTSCPSPYEEDDYDDSLGFASVLPRPRMSVLESGPSRRRWKRDHSMSKASNLPARGSDEKCGERPGFLDSVNS